jgi:ribokinase
VDLSRLATVRAPTACAAVCVGPDGGNQIAVGSGANLLASAQQIEDTMLRPGAVLLLQMEVPPAEVAVAVMRARGARRAGDPEPGAGGGRPAAGHPGGARPAGGE